MFHSIIRDYADLDTKRSRSSMHSFSHSIESSLKTLTQVIKSAFPSNALQDSWYPAKFTIKKLPAITSRTVPKPASLSSTISRNQKFNRAKSYSQIKRGYDRSLAGSKVSPPKYRIVGRVNEQFAKSPVIKRRDQTPQSNRRSIISLKKLNQILQSRKEYSVKSREKCRSSPRVHWDIDRVLKEIECSAVARDKDKDYELKLRENEENSIKGFNANMSEVKLVKDLSKQSAIINEISETIKSLNPVAIPKRNGSEFKGGFKQNYGKEFLAALALGKNAVAVHYLEINRSLIHFYNSVFSFLQ